MPFFVSLAKCGKDTGQVGRQVRVRRTNCPSVNSPMTGPDLISKDFLSIPPI